MTDTNGPLHGVTVLDMSSTLMGPYCTLLLAQLGARVVKIESPQGDIVRFIGDASDKGLGPPFLNVNRGKESVILDLKTPDGKAALERLISEVDVLVHNMRPAAVERLGFHSDRVLELNPKIIYCHVVGYGSRGPYRDKPAYDDVVQAASAVASVQGGESGPSYVRTPIADKAVAIMAMGAVCAALYERSNSGRGQAIEVPMFESMAAFTLLEQQGDRVHEGATGGTGYPRTNSPYRKPYRTADGTIAAIVYTDQQWSQFFSLINRPDLADDPRLSSIRGRTENIDELYQLIETHLASKTTAEWLSIFEESSIPAMPVRDIEGLFEDEHLQKVGLFERVEHPDLGPLVQAKLPWTFSRTPPPKLTPAPALGQHTQSVLEAMGWDERPADDGSHFDATRTQGS